MSDIKLACDMAEQVKTICDKHGNKPGELINILHEAQHLQGYLPEEDATDYRFQTWNSRIESVWCRHFLHPFSLP